MAGNWALRLVGSVLLFAVLPTASAVDITGEIIIKRKLTKRNVSSVASAYYRGPAIQGAGAASVEDPLAFERRHVVIYIDGNGQTARSEAVLTQENRRFDPDLLVVSAGSTVSFPNRDLVFHNVFSLSKSKLFDLGNYPKNQTRAVTFQKPGVVFVNCHLHPNMGATIVVTPNSWWTRAEEDGRFTLKGIPPGRYTVVAWHKNGGTHKKVIDVREGVESKVSFIVPFAEDGTLLDPKAN